jgi:hypothetical protein
MSGVLGVVKNKKWKFKVGDRVRHKTYDSHMGTGAIVDAESYYQTVRYAVRWDRRGSGLYYGIELDRVTNGLEELIKALI